MNIRRKKYRVNRIKGMNQYNAAKSAGYSENVARHHIDRLEKGMKGGILEALEQAGITDKYQAESLYKLTLTPNRSIRLNTFKHISELKKQSVPQATNQVNYSQINIKVVTNDGDNPIQSAHKSTNRMERAKQV